MRVLVNGLSIGSLSGRHVVYGFLRPLAAWTREQHEYVLVTYESESPPRGLLRENVRRIEVSDRLRPWWKRTPWERLELPKLVKRERIDLVLTASGATVPGCPAPQVSLAQNPWCFVSAAQVGIRSRVKAVLQRRAYRQALGTAQMMIYLSHYLEAQYARLAVGGTMPRSEVAYPALDDDTHDSAAAWRARQEKDPLLIVSVSAMAPWKRAETVVSALGQLRAGGVEATLRLVGPWPDWSYRARIERQVEATHLSDVVQITGEVSKSELHRHYAEAKVFCLMSACESYGIPAAEAQAFGTPVVSTRDCAISEVCEGAGLFGPVDDTEWTTQALNTMLSDEKTWQSCSRRAIQNARALRWDSCARPLMSMFEVA